MRTLHTRSPCSPNLAAPKADQSSQDSPKRAMGSVASAQSSASAAAWRDFRRTNHNAPPAIAPTATATFHFTRSTLAARDQLAILIHLAPCDQAWAGTVSVYEATPRGTHRCTACPGGMWRTARQPTAAERDYLPAAALKRRPPPPAQVPSQARAPPAPHRPRCQRSSSSV